MSKEERRKERQPLYQSKQWKELRKAYYEAHPLCERCLQDIHHKLSPFKRGLTEEEKYRRAFDPNNLMALCVECHIKEHRKGELTIYDKLDKYKD